jgi:ornithine carbamoyltransferase
MSVTITMPAGLLRVADLSAAQLRAVLELGEQMRDGPSWWTGVHARGTLTCLLDEPPDWTGASFQEAARRLGMVTTTLRPGELEQAPADSRAILAATSAHAALERLAQVATVPVVNASTRDHHPCQALVDLLTLRRHFGYLDGIRVAYVGDVDNVAQSLLEACALAGMHLAVATPQGSALDHDVVVRALALAAEHGGSVQIGHDPHAAVALADVVYAGESSEVDHALVKTASPWAVRMRRRPDEETEADVIAGAGSLAREQASNRVPVAQALLHSIVADGSGDG